MCTHKKETEEIRNTHTGESNMKTEAEIGVIQPQTKEYQQPPEARRGKEHITPLDLVECGPHLLTPYFRPSDTEFVLLVSRTMRE